MIDRSKPPIITDAINYQFDLKPIETEIGENTIPVYALNAGSQEVVQVEWVFEAGLWSENKTGVAQATAAMLKNGTVSKTSYQLNDLIEYYGASLRIGINNDFCVITLTTLSKYLSHLLPVVKDVLENANFPQQELDLYKQNILERLSIQLKKNDFIANRYIDQSIYGKAHPYGRFTELEDIHSLTRGDLVAHFKQYFNSDSCQIFIAGNYSSIHYQELLEQFTYQKWGEAKNEGAIKCFEIIPPTNHESVIQLDEHAVQGAIRVGKLFPKRTHQDFMKLTMVNTLLGGYFGSRLMNNIREKKGYTYGIYSQIYAYKHASNWLVSSEVGADVAVLAVKEVYFEIDKLQQEKVSEQELLLVKNYVLGNVLGDLDGPFSIMQKWKSMILNKLPFDNFDKNIEVYKTITTDEVLNLSQKHFQLSTMKELIVY